MGEATFGPAGPGAPPAKRPGPRDPLRRWARGCPCCAYLRALLAVAIAALAIQMSFLALTLVAERAPVCEGYMSDRGECG